MKRCFGDMPRRFNLVEMGVFCLASTFAGACLGTRVVSGRLVTGVGVVHTEPSPNVEASSHSCAETEPSVALFRDWVNEGVLMTSSCAASLLLFDIMSGFRLLLLSMPRSGPQSRHLQLHKLDIVV